MKIISYNVNGIRAALSKDLIKWLTATQADVLCLQEIKATVDQIDTKLFEALGYAHYWYPAQKKGYSGVGILSKIKPQEVIYGINQNDFDAEGRNILIDLGDIAIMSMYLPSASNMDRLDFKYAYMDYLYDYTKNLLTKYPKVIIAGDYNICHQAIDIHDPIRNAKVSGFLPEERAWMSKFLSENRFIDSFRHFNTAAHHYSWWSYRANARANNKGWRIDYLMASNALQPQLKSAYILPEAKHSDHCPIGLELIGY